jgi:CRP-like cAMP-binding protein
MADDAAEGLQRFLRRLLLRSALTAAEQGAILAVEYEVSQAAPHQDLVVPGGEVDYSLLVRDGLAGRFDQMADGSRQITALHIPGDMCDLHSVPVPVPGWGVTALATSTILRVSHKSLRSISTTYPAIAHAFWRDTTVDGSVLSKWVSNLGRRDAHSRLAHLLCELGMRMELAQLGSRTCFVLPIRQSQLADVLGVTAVHVNRTLQLLRKEDVIRSEGSTIHVENLGRLEAIADFDPAYLLLEGAPGPRPETG